VKRQSQSELGKFRSEKSKSGRSTPDNNNQARVVRCIRSLPAGTVSSYGAIARAAGWPGAARQVVRILRQVRGLPWHRVVGAGGAIKLTGENAAEQQFRLRMEGVTFRGARVDMKVHEFQFSKLKRARSKN
jgi:methylated-DNA-protein-cysteine methyltransferase-like protein